MGVCESKNNLPAHISQHSIEKLSENPAETAKLKAVQHNNLIDKAKNIIDAANDKIYTLQERCKEYKVENENLEKELQLLKARQEEKDEITKKYKNQLDVQRETMLKWKEKIQTLSEEIVNIEQERKENDFKYKNNLLSINDTLYKIHGDNTSKLKYNKQSKKFVIFTDKINHLFYYDENGPKYIIIRDISITNDLIQKQMNKPWFLVIGDKRSALFAADNITIRDKWVNFIKKSLNQYNNSDLYFDYSHSNSAINPIYCVDNTLENELNIQLNGQLDTNRKNTNQIENQKIQKQFGKSQSPINIIHSKHTKIMKINEFEINPLQFNYPSKINGCTILNNGHTVQININNNSKCNLLINHKIYQLKQFHFHTPSEHTIDNKQYEMEMHLVHINQQTNKIVVLGFIFTTQQKYIVKPKLELTKSRAHLILLSDNCDNYGSDDKETDDDHKTNDFLNQFLNELPSSKTDQDIPLSPLSFDYLFQTSSNNFIKNIKTNAIDIDMEIFQYMGSLTTPPYTEGVQWLLSKNTHFISQKQLKTLSACWNNQNNARPVQDYFGRQVSLRSKSSLRVVS